MTYSGKCGPHGCNPIVDRCDQCKRGWLDCRCAKTFEIRDEITLILGDVQDGKRSEPKGLNAGLGLRTTVHNRKPHPWNPVKYNGWHDVSYDERPEPKEWVLVWGVGMNGQGRLGVGMINQYVTDHEYWQTWPINMRVTHWMPAPHEPGSTELNDCALLDWAGSDEERVEQVARSMVLGFSIRESFRRVIERWESYRKSKPESYRKKG